MPSTIDLGRGHVIHDRFEERPQIGFESIRRRASAAIPGDGVDHREIELVGVGRQIKEEILRQRDDFLGTGSGAVDLVDDDDRSQAQRERLLKHGARLRHRAFDRVDQQQAAVGHVEHALDLAAEVGVAGRVDDIDLHAVRR